MHKFEHDLFRFCLNTFLNDISYSNEFDFLRYGLCITLVIKTEVLLKIKFYFHNNISTVLQCITVLSFKDNKHTVRVNRSTDYQYQLGNLIVLMIMH